ncbi:MAG: class IV adenylate cyclase [Patescibacteria group bacterium]
MNIEIEVKLKVRSLAKIKQRLKLLKAKYLGLVWQVDTYYQVSKNYYLKGVPKLRIREERNKGKAFLEYHEAVNNFKAKEFETEVSNAKMAKIILEKFGYKPGLMVDKKREKYRLGRINIDLDSVKGLGSFVEIEIMNKNEKESLKEIYDFLPNLGLSKKDIIAGKSYLGLVWEKARK